MLDASNDALSVIFALVAEQVVIILAQGQGKAFDGAERSAQVMRSTVSERFKLLPGIGQVGGAGSQFFFQRLDFGLGFEGPPGGLPAAFAAVLTEPGNDQADE